MRFSSLMMIKKNSIRLIFIGFLFLQKSFLFGQVNVESIYIKEFKTVGKNEYTRKLLSLSTIKPEKKWNNYQGGPINIDTLKYQFDNKALYKAFPTNFAIHKNNYIAFYYSLKESKCPTLFSLLNYYQDVIDSNLIAHQLPLQLKLLPAFCSAFNPYSSNGIGGEGFWHISYPQAIKYGLRVDEFIDERRDFNKSTRAAILYLKDLYKMYGDWELTLAAYSSGVTTVNKYLKRTKSSSFKDIHPYLPSETKDFVQAFVAMNYIYNYDSFGSVLLNPKIKSDTITTDKQIQFKALADILPLKLNELTFLNLSINKAIFPKQTTMHLPIGLKQKFVELKDSISFYQDSVLLKPIPKPKKVTIPENGEPFIYVVESGDVLGIIANRYHVRVSQIQDWNNLRSTRINLGQKLTIYGKNSSKKRQEKKKKVIKQKVNNIAQKPVSKKSNHDKVIGHSTYTVKSGDNLWIIAKKFSGVSAQNIMDYNSIDNNLNVGQVLKIPKY